MEDKRSNVAALSLEQCMQLACNGDSVARYKFQEIMSRSLFVELLDIKSINEHPKFIAKKNKEVFSFISKQAKSGNQYAVALLGWLHKVGIGTKESIKNATEYYKKSADAGNSFGCYFLGDLYRYSNDAKLRSSKKAMDSYIIGAKNGDVSCLYELGLLHEKGAEDFPKDPGLAEQYFEQAVKRGSPEALFHKTTTFEQRQNFTEVNPYYFFFPSHTLFECTVKFETFSAVRGAYSIDTVQAISAAIITITYPAVSGVSQFRHEKKIPCADYDTFVRSITHYGFKEIKTTYEGIAGSRANHNLDLARMVFRIKNRKDFAAVIEEADSLYIKHIAEEKSKPKAPAPHATPPQNAFPGQFFPQPTAQSNQQAQALAMMQMQMQMMQQNPEYAAQMASLMSQQLQTMNLQQGQDNTSTSGHTNTGLKK